MTAHVMKRDGPLPDSSIERVSPRLSQRRLLLGQAAIGWELLAIAPVAGGQRNAAGAGNAAGAADASRRPDCAGAAPADRPFWFGFIGDTPYSRLEAGALRRVLAAMSAEPLAFVVHVGDIKSSLETCDDDLLSSRLDLLGESAHPLVLTPGDNEWTDCNRSVPPWLAGGSLERLAWLRARAFAHPESLGRRRMALQQQGPYLPEAAGTAFEEPGALLADKARHRVHRKPPRLPENFSWRIGSLQFCTLHVVGSNNGPRHSPQAEQAWLLRQQANGDWLDATVRRALREQARGLVIAMHANMRFEDDRSDGWEHMRKLVIAAAVAFDGPVLLLHGDTHRFRNDRMLRRSHGLGNFQRAECFGSPFSSAWVQIRWDPSRAQPGAGTESDPFLVSARALS